MSKIRIDVSSDYFSFSEVVNESKCVRRLIQIRKMYEQADDHFKTMKGWMEANGNFHDYINIDGEEKIKIQTTKL